MGVDNSITPEDRCYIKKILDEVGGLKQLPINPGYEDELKFIEAVQHAVLTYVPYERKKRPLPYGKPREPRDIYEFKGKRGQCCDRSRLLEKIFRLNNFGTRHIFLYYGGALKGLFKNKNNHALSEVETKKGWLVVDSNTRWLSLDIDKRSIPIKNIRSENIIHWKECMPMRSDIKEQCEKSFNFLYGLYCRSGKQYPPFWLCPKNSNKEIKWCCSLLGVF